MSEKPEADDFEEDLDEAELDADDADLDQATRELELARRSSNHGKAGTPAWRRLELLMEQKRTAELTSDFDDYDIDTAPRSGRARR